MNKGNYVFIDKSKNVNGIAYTDVCFLNKQNIRSIEFHKNHYLDAETLYIYTTEVEFFYAEDNKYTAKNNFSYKCYKFFTGEFELKLDDNYNIIITVI